MPSKARTVEQLHVKPSCQGHIVGRQMGDGDTEVH